MSTALSGALPSQRKEIRSKAVANWQQADSI
jgi:hypothetical protein